MTDTENTFLNLPSDEMNNAQELEVLESEEEVKLRVVDANTDVNKSGNPYLLVKFEATEYANVKDFTKYFGLPHNEMTPKQKNNALLSLRKFFQAFEIEYSKGVDVGNITGSEGFAILGVDQNEGSEFGPQNFIKRFVAA